VPSDLTQPRPSQVVFGHTRDLKAGLTGSSSSVAGQVLFAWVTSASSVSGRLEQLFG
jgi:hypothetical protein